MTRRYAARVDANQRAIVRALRAAGCSVQSLATVGAGCPDLLVGRTGSTYLMEVKIPMEKLNTLQRDWHARWRGVPVDIVTSVDEALRAVGAVR